MAAAECLHYDGDRVTLAGHVKLKTFFGPPNYGENLETDSRETQAILLLAQPICVKANPANYEPAEQDQSEVTLVPLNKENLTQFMGRQVLVEGKLFHAHTGHHHTSVLIEINRIKIETK